METKIEKSKPNLILSTSQIAAFFDVTRFAVHKWRKAGCPQIKFGQFNLKAVFDWWMENLAESKIPDTERLQVLKAEHLTEKIKGVRLKNAQLEGSMVAWTVIDTEWAGRVAVVTSGLTAFADRLPPLLEGKGRVQMQEVIKKEVWELRDAYARKGKYTPTKEGVKKPVKRKKKVGKSRKKVVKRAIKLKKPIKKKG
jgi:phage terminase Nu1 subunit (DNA packaging protein)